jgi:hypothetical protein
VIKYTNGTPPLGKDETVFSTLDTFKVIKVLDENNGACMTIVGDAEAYSLTRVSEFTYAFQTNQVTLELICANIYDVIGEIIAKQTWTMIWSNAADYINYTNFHWMAKTCSAHGNTHHFVYSMKWVT